MRLSDRVRRLMNSPQGRRAIERGRRELNKPHNRRRITDVLRRISGRGRYR